MMHEGQAIIVHYHIYKNAGSSVDAAIRSALGASSLVELDKDSRFSGSPALNRALIERAATDHPELRAFSAHRIVPTVHYSSRFDVRAIVFLRHPLLRAASVHRFESKRSDDAGRSYREAREMGFAQWLDWAVRPGNSIQVNNYQTCLLSLAEDGTLPVEQAGPHRIGDLAVAMHRLDDLPVVGIVEEYDISARLIEASVADVFPEVRLSGVEVNRTRQVSNWVEEVQQLERSLDTSTLALFREANAQDFALFERYLAVLQQRAEAA